MPWTFPSCTWYWAPTRSSADGRRPADVSGDAAGGSGNRARDHLANERTYLSWLRTSLGVLALAAAVARFGAGEGHSVGLAVEVLGLLGIAILGIGTRRYYQVVADLEQGRFTF